MKPRALALINGQSSLVQLQDGQVNRRRIDRADVAPAAGAGPTAVCALGLYQGFERGLAVLAPGEAIRRLGFGEELAETLVPQDVQRLGPVVVSVFVVAHPAT